MPIGYRYNTNMILPESMASILDANIRIELTDIDFKEMLANAKNGTPW
jgi:hypothetical protein